MAERADAALPGRRGGRDGAPAATPYVRPKTTPRRVIWVDRLADWTISIGGLAVIAAVFAIMAFLVQVVVPLFTGASASEPTRYELPAVARRARPPGRPRDGRVRHHRPRGLRGRRDRGLPPADGSPPRRESSLDLGAAPATAFARTLAGGDVVFGFADGTVRFGRIAILAEVLPGDAVPAGLDAACRRRAHRRQRGLLGAPRRPAPPGGARRRARRPAEPLGAGRAPIVALDFRVGGSVERPTRAYVDRRRHRRHGARSQRVAHEPADEASSPPPCPASSCRAVPGLGPWRACC